jgi:hypothetical protein
LIRLCASLLGRRAEAEDTAELLAPYGEWGGLASVYLLASLPLLGRGKPRLYAGPPAGGSESPDQTHDGGETSFSMYGLGR